MNHLTKSESARLNGAKSRGPVKHGLTGKTVRLRRTWRYQTAMLDIEMDAQAPDFEKKFEKYDEDMRGSSAFTNLADKSTGLRAAIHFDIHLSRTYRRTLEQLRRLRQSENEPTKPPKTGLNDEKQHLKGEPE